MGVGVIWLVEESKEAKEAKKALTAGRVDTREHITATLETKLVS